MPLGILGIFSTIRSAVNTISYPATLPLTGWWRASFTAAPWAANSSTGTSLANGDLVTAAADPISGMAINGFNPVDFDGTQWLATTPDNTSFFGSSGSFFCLFYARTAPAAVNNYSDGSFLSDQSNAETTFGFSSLGIGASILDNSPGYQRLSIPCPAAEWHLAQFKWDGFYLYGRVDGQPWEKVTCGPYTPSVPSSMTVGRSYAGAILFDGQILEIGTSDVVLTDAEFDGILSYCNTRYGLNLGFSSNLLSLTGWWKDFIGTPWAGAASLGVSSSYPLVTGISDPVGGTAQNGHTPATFNGTNTFISTGTETLDTFVNADAGSLWVLFKANAVPTVDLSLPYNAAGLLAINGSGYLTAAVSDQGFVVAGYDTQYNTFAVPASTATYHLGQIRWDGIRMWGRIDGGSWYSIPCGPLGYLASALGMGSNFDNTVFFDGDILEAGLIDKYLSKEAFVKIKESIETQYGLSLGSETDSVEITKIVDIQADLGAGTLTSAGPGSWDNQTTHKNSYTSVTSSTVYPEQLANQFASGTLPSIYFPLTGDALLETQRFYLPYGLTFYATFKTTYNDGTSDYAGDAPMTIIGDDTGGIWLSFGLVGGEVTYRHYSGGWLEAVSTGGSLDDGNVHTIAATHDHVTGVAKVYVDGVEAGNNTIAYGTIYAAHNSIGCGYAMQDGLKDFHLAEVQIWNGVKTGSEIAAMHVVSMNKWNA